MSIDNSRSSFYANLMELPFYRFDVVLRMDWLIKHKVKIEFELKRVTLQSSEGKKVIVDCDWV